MVEKSVNWFLLSIIVIRFIYSICAETEYYKKCKIDFLNQCPANSTCLQKDGSDGFCICDRSNNFYLNPKNGSDPYCIRITPPINSEEDVPSKQSYQQFNKHTHIIGGIVIPLLGVVIVISLVYLAKRYKVIVRIRQSWRNRHRRQPVYEDVYLGNPADEPPLI